MKTKVVFFWLVCLTIFLAGCWDQKTIQDIYYVGTIGVDYKDNKFETYLQLLDFSTVAKIEQGKPTEKAPIWIVTGSGSTLFDAIRDAKKASQQPIVFSHVSSYILTEAALSNHFNDTLDLIRRYPDFRLSGWIFGTKDDLVGILNAAPILNNSQLSLIDHTPQGITKQFNRIPPLMALDFIREYRDMSRTVVLPNLSLGQSWYSGGKPNPLPFIDGAFLFKDKKYRDWFSEESLIGYRWIVPNTKRTLLKVIDSEKNTTLEVAIWKVKPQININIKQGSPEFDIHIEGRATILNGLKKRKIIKSLYKTRLKMKFN